MNYVRDSADSPLPDGFQWSRASPRVRFWFDSLTPNARAVLKQTRGLGTWRRMHGDSIMITLWLEFVTSAHIRFAPTGRPTGGTIEWLNEAGSPIERYRFIAQSVTCPHLDPPANGR